MSYVVEPFSVTFYQWWSLLAILKAQKTLKALKKTLKALFLYTNNEIVTFRKELYKTYVKKAEGFAVFKKITK
jgi:hypothetical protein